MAEAGRTVDPAPFCSGTGRTDGCKIEPKAGLAGLTQLKGMTWDHVRGYGPLDAVTELFRRIHPEVSIHWDRRSLKDFGDYPVAVLAREYDIILIDHPHVGICAEQGVLVPLDEHVPAGYLAEQEAHSVGPSYASYNWGGHQWALAVDAAAQVAAYRPDVLSRADLPATWEKVRALAGELAPGRSIGWPLCPTDAMCSFLTLCANFGGKRFFDEAEGVPREVGEAALELMFELLPLLHESSLRSNPIQMYERMAAAEDIVYVPLAFGYTNYSRKNFPGRRIYFADAPSTTGVPGGSLLGGVGMAVSAFSGHIPLAVEFTMLAAHPDVQRTIYFTAGGQPGHLAAWRDEAINRECGDFFTATRRTLDNSYMRPRTKVFPVFQEQAGIVIHEALSRKSHGESVSAAHTVASLNELYRGIVLRGAHRA